MPSPAMRKATFFLSDLHLGAAYDPDSRSREKRVVAFLDSIKDEAKAIYLLGDILDYWYEYRYVVPRGHVRLFGKLAELSDAGLEITWLTGNHDIWIFDYLPNELGIKVVDSAMRVNIDGKEFYLAHGDRTGCDSPWFMAMQRMFRSKILQKLFAMINPRWTVPFALRWSSSSRQKPQLAEDDEKTSHALDRLSSFCREYLQSHQKVQYFIFGHLHVVAERDITKTAKMMVIGDWLAHYSYARFENGHLTLHTYQNTEVRK